MHHVRYIGMFAASALLWVAATGTATAADFPKGTFTLKGPDGAIWAVKLDGKDKFTVTRDGKEPVEAAPAGELGRSGATRSRRWNCDTEMSPAVLPAVSYRDVRRW